MIVNGFEGSSVYGGGEGSGGDLTWTEGMEDPSAFKDIVARSRKGRNETPDDK